METDAASILMRFHNAIAVANDAVVHRWFVLASNLERFPNRLNLLEQATIEYTVLWAKVCVLNAQGLWLFATAQFSPSLGMGDRRLWCQRTLDALCVLCGERVRSRVL